MFKLKEYLKKYTAECIISPLFKFLEAVFELLVPVLMAEIIDIGIKYGNSEYVYFLTMLMCMFAFFGVVCSVIAQYYASKAAHGYGTDLRKAVFNKINSLTHSQLDKIGSPTLITRLSADINRSERGVNRFLRLFLRSPFIIFGSLVASFIIDFRMGLIVLGATALIGLAVYLVMHLTIPRNKRVSKALDQVNRLAGETVSGARVIRAFARQDEEFCEFKKSNDALTKIQIVTGRISALLNPVTILIINLGIGLALYFGAQFVSVGSLTQGEINALVNYFTQILLSLVVFANLIVTVASGSASTERVKEILDLTPDMIEGEIESVAPTQTPIVFNGVSFRYNESSQNALDGVTFSVTRGETVGIIGGIGSGKTTLINLLARFYDATDGEILIDGINVKDYKFKALRNKFGIALQKVALFKGSVRENVAYGKPNATDEEIFSALKTAQALDLASGQLGLDKAVETGGKNLSGGQRQRLALARAIVKQPEILILDDSSSSLDYLTDLNLRRAIKQDLTNTTLIVVSQRVTSVENADKIIVLDDGKVVGIGTDATLRKKCPVYKEICLSQSSKGAKNED